MHGDANAAGGHTRIHAPGSVAGAYHRETESLFPQADAGRGHLAGRQVAVDLGVGFVRARVETYVATAQRDLRDFPAAGEFIAPVKGATLIGNGGRRGLTFAAA